eukprot:2034956-Rhodomonas_salina.1
MRKRGPGSSIAYLSTALPGSSIAYLSTALPGSGIDYLSTTLPSSSTNSSSRSTSVLDSEGSTIRPLQYWQEMW